MEQTVIFLYKMREREQQPAEVHLMELGSAANIC